MPELAAATVDGERVGGAAPIGGPLDAGQGRPRPTGTTGARADDIAGLTSTEVERLAGLVSHVASSYSTGPVISRTFGPMGLLRDQGFGTVFVAAIRDRGVPSGLLVLAGPDAGIIEPEAVQALELLCVLAGVTLARIGPR